MPVKLIGMGDNGTGKTCALASLCAAGYQVRLLNLDNGVEALIDVLTSPGSQYPKEAIRNLRWKTLTEPMRSVGGNYQPKAATVWTRTSDMVNEWKGDERWQDGAVVKCEDKLGDPYKWGSECVLALDTLSTLGTAANNFNLMMNGNLGKNRTQNEGRRDVGAAQIQVDKFLQFIFDEGFRCNVVLNTHIVYAQEDGSFIPDNFDGTRFAFPAVIGKSLSTQMGKYFNHLLMYKKEGEARRIYTRGLPNARLKSGAPLRVAASYDAKDGLAKYFEAVQGPLSKPKENAA